MEPPDLDENFLDYAVRSSLLQFVDTFVLAQLHDGRTFVGYLRSFDQYNTLILEQCSERVIAGARYCDVAQGLLVLRGDNIAMMGTLRDRYPSNLEAATESELRRLAAQDTAAA